MLIRNCPPSQVQKILRAHPEIVADAVQNLKDPFLKSGGAPSPGAESFLMSEVPLY